MSSNKKILQDHVNIKALRARKQELERLVAKLNKELVDVEDRLYDAEQVNLVLEGIAVSVIKRAHGKSIEMFTLASGKSVRQRQAKVYQRANSAYWGVSVNSVKNSTQEFYCGRAIGLVDTLTRTQAMNVAKRWLTGDRTVLEYRSHNQ